MYQSLKQKYLVGQVIDTTPEKLRIKEINFCIEAESVTFDNK